jgi:hypothetical protein
MSGYCCAPRKKWRFWCTFYFQSVKMTFVQAWYSNRAAFNAIKYEMFHTTAIKPLSYGIYFQSYRSAIILLSCELYWRNGDKSVSRVTRHKGQQPRNQTISCLSRSLVHRTQFCCTVCWVSYSMGIRLNNARVKHWGRNIYCDFTIKLFIQTKTSVTDEC